MSPSSAAQKNQKLLYLRLLIHVPVIILGLQIFTHAAGPLARETSALWTIGAPDVAGVRYKIAQGPWTALTDGNSPILFPLSIQSGPASLHLSSRNRTINLAPNTSVRIEQPAPDRLAVTLEEGAVIYDLQKTGRIEINVASKALLAAETGPGAFPGQVDPACTGGVLYQKPDWIRARSLQGNTTFKELAANQQQHGIDAGNLLCLDLSNNTVSVEEDSASIESISASPPPDPAAPGAAAKFKKGEIQIRNLQGALTYSETGNHHESKVGAGVLYVRNLMLNKDSSLDDSIAIHSLSKGPDNKLKFFRSKSPWEILAGGAVGITPDPATLAGAAPATGALAACLLLTDKPDQVEYCLAGGPFIRPTQKITPLALPFTIRTKDVTACLKAQGYLIEIAPQTNFQLDRGPSPLAGTIEKGAVLYELQNSGSFDIKVKDYALIHAESAPRVFEAQPATGCVGGIFYQVATPLGFFGEYSPWVIGAGAVMAGSAVAVGVTVDNHDKPKHHDDRHDVSPSKPAW